MFKFNGGQGAVTCDHCRKMIDANLSYDEYERTWGRHGDDGDFCMMCKMDVPAARMERCEEIGAVAELG